MLMRATALLETNGYAVTSEADSDVALKRIQAAPPDLLLLDIRMPKKDGFDVCRALKANPATKNIPVIFLSVQAGEADIVAGLELGAEDYIRKPFRKRELLARVKTILRRRETTVETNQVNIGPLSIDLNTYAVLLDGKTLTLEPKEFQLLAFFMKREGQVLTRATISENVWGHEHIPTSKTIEVRVDQLRKKLGASGHWIRTLRGIGYRFEVSEHGEEAE
jgi:DNA-binding response OmpR family regulator